ncbi:MAG: hypothetical protein D6795_11850 [Deltaproteobacteria bacterium]|nr:MAG: hypothetical protein D6795_11850 [Deltaproteobacteria bacterium]
MLLRSVPAISMPFPSNADGRLQSRSSVGRRRSIVQITRSKGGWIMSTPWKAFAVVLSLALFVFVSLGPVSSSCDIDGTLPRQWLFVGFTEAVFDGNIGGYPAGRAACEAEYGLGTHVCTMSEISRSLQLDLVEMEEGQIAWYFTARGIPFLNGMTECNGFTSADEFLSGSCLYKSPEGPIFPVLCSCMRDGETRDPIPLACCRFTRP